MQISREEEVALWKAYVEKNDLRAFKKLKYSLRPFFNSILDGKLNTDGSIDKAQILARIDATLPNLLKKYDPSKGQLNTFLKSHLDGITKNAVKENQLEAHVPRTEATQLSHYVSGTELAKMEYGPSPTDKQIFQFTPNFKDLNELQRVRQYHVRTTIGDVNHGDDEDPLQFKDQFLNNNFLQNDLDISLKMNEVKNLLSTLNPQEKRIVEEYVFNDRTITEIALTLGLSSSQVRRVIKSWQQKVKAKGFGQ